MNFGNTEINIDIQNMNFGNTEINIDIHFNFSSQPWKNLINNLINFGKDIEISEKFTRKF